MVVAAGTGADVRSFWLAVAEILLLTQRASHVAIEYSDRWGAGTVSTGGDETAAPVQTQAWREGDDRHVRLRIAPRSPDAEPLERELTAAAELAVLVGRRAALEHERRIGTFLVELSRWMRTAATDPRQLLHYTARSAMALVGAHGALVLERGGDGKLRIVSVTGAAEAFGQGGPALDASLFAHVMAAGNALLTDRLADEPEVPTEEARRDDLAAAMIAPLPTSGEPAGVLVVHRVRSRPGGDERFTLADLSHLQAVASHIGNALELSWAVRAARQAARRASAMVDGSPLPLALLGATGRIMEANPAFVALFDFESQDRVRDQHLDAFPLILDRATPLEALDLAASGVPWRGRARVLRAAGGERQCEAFFTALGEDDDAACLLTLHDRTDELRARREMVAREKLATVGTLAAGVAHEVNNPLAAARMEAELLAMQHASPEVAAASAAIIREVDRAARIAKSLLRLATQEHGRMQDTRVNRVLADIVAVRAPLLAETGVALRLTASRELSPVLARAGDLEQVFLHLLTNAEDAVRGRPRQEIEIAAAPAGDGIRVTVDDTGTGVAADLRTRVFDPFYTTKAPDKASGLGLAMCQRIVSELGGRIWLEDSPLGGARCVVDLPSASARS